MLKNYLKYENTTGKFFWIKVPSNRVKLGSEAGSINKNTGYIEIRFKGQHYYAHRLAWEMYYGTPPTQIIDHINQDPSDNRIMNLRQVDNTTNCRNCKKSKNNSNGYPGVQQLPGGRWRALLMVDRKYKHLGVFDTPEEAAAVRAKEKLKYNFHRNHS